MTRYSTILGGCFALLCLIAAVAVSQPALPQPQQSPKAIVSQTIGISEVEVNYHRPGVKGRTIWGGLVPYDVVWRAGANENTTIRFPQAVSVEGSSLPAGTYGLHMIPSKTTWTVIFSKNFTSWGSFHYDQAEDALRVTVTPRACEHHEWLEYAFSDLSDSSALLTLSWEKLQVPIRIAFDTPSIVLAEARDSYLRGLAGFSWAGFNNAAAYCARKGINLAEALKWIDRSIGMNENFTNLRTKADILDRMGRQSEAKSTRDKSMKLATEGELNNLGYSYLNAGKIKDALDMFERNVKAHPDSWNVYDSLAEGLEKGGDKAGAIKNYERALKMVNDEANKKRISDTISKLKSQ